MVLDNIPENINKRLSSISSNRKCFNEELYKYQKALKEAGYDFILEYEKGSHKASVRNIHGNRTQKAFRAGGLYSHKPR